MSYENFVRVKVVTPVTAVATSFAIVDAVAPNKLPPAGGGFLVLCDSPGNPSFIEVIKYGYRTGLGLYDVLRGQEGTTAVAWSGNVYAFQALMAGETQLIQTTLAGKQAEIVAGTTSQFWRGDKTWVDFMTTVRAALLTGFSAATATAVAATDTVLEAFGKLQGQLNLKAPLASPALTGVPTAPTAALGTNTTQLATMEAIQAAIANLINGAPGALDALNELATALGNDPNFATTMTNALAGKEPTITQLPINKGGTGATTQAGAQTALGLVPTANNYDRTTGRVLRVGDFGLGSAGIDITNANFASASNTAHRLNSPYTNGPTAQPYTIFCMVYDSEITQLAFFEGEATTTVWVRKYKGATSSWGSWVQVLQSSSVINTLDSTTANAPLSANQGRVLATKVGDNPEGYTGSIDDVDAVPAGLTSIGTSATGTKPPSKTYGFLMTMSSGSGATGQTHQIWYDYDGTIGTKTTWKRDKYGSGIWGTWRMEYDQNNVIGAVSAVGAAANSGAIIERGANANGEFIKFMDGTLICWKALNLNSTGTYPVGPLYGSDAYAGGNFPSTYSAIPAVTAGCYQSGRNPSLMIPSSFGAWTQTSWGSWRGIAADNGAYGATIFLTAIGRWN